MEDWVKAFRTKDIDGVMAIHAPEIVSFDLVPPLQYVGVVKYREPWEQTFTSYEGLLAYEIYDLTITMGDDIAFSHSLNRMGGTMKDGPTIIVRPLSRLFV